MCSVSLFKECILLLKSTDAISNRWRNWKSYLEVGTGKDHRVSYILPQGIPRSQEKGKLKLRLMSHDGATAGGCEIDWTPVLLKCDYCQVAMPTLVGTDFWVIISDPFSKI